MKQKYSLGYLTIPETHPVDQIEIAAACGYDGVGLRPISMHLPGEPDYSFTHDDLFENVRAALARTGIRLYDIEVARIDDETDVRSYEPELARAAQLGAQFVITSVWTDNRAYALEQLKILGGLCEKYGLLLNLEFMGFSCVKTMEEAQEVISQVGCQSLRLMVDLLHAHRAGVTAESLKQVPAGKLGFIHLCDGPAWVPPVDHPDMKGVAREGRLYVGEGGIDIAGMLKAMPDVPYYSFELPNLADINGAGKLAHARRCLETAKEYMARNGIGEDGAKAAESDETAGLGKTDGSGKAAGPGNADGSGRAAR